VAAVTARWCARGQRVRFDTERNPVSSLLERAVSPPAGVLLRSLRLDRNLSQKELAAALRRSNATVVKLERGRSEPTVEELRRYDRSLRLPEGTTGSLLDHVSGTTAARDIETYELRSLLPVGPLDLVTTAVREEVRIGSRGVVQVRVQQRVHAVRDNPGSYWFPYAQGSGQPTIRVSPELGCVLGGWPRLLIAGRLAQEIRLTGGPMHVGEERQFGFTIRYDNRDNPATEDGLHRRVGTPTLAWMKMRVMVPPGGAMIKKASWTDRSAEPRATEVHLVRQESKVLSWDRPGDVTCGFFYWLAS
jgi:transcriptional regulator with XRE-family HTH domain